LFHPEIATTVVRVKYGSTVRRICVWGYEFLCFLNVLLLWGDQDQDQDQAIRNGFFAAAAAARGGGGDEFDGAAVEAAFTRKKWQYYYCSWAFMVVTVVEIRHSWSYSS
jgi:hypothetical protein